MALAEKIGVRHTTLWKWTNDAATRSKPANPSAAARNMVAKLAKDAGLPDPMADLDVKARRRPPSTRPVPGVAMPSEKVRSTRPATRSRG